jgi:hypothetical protein
VRTSDPPPPQQLRDSLFFLLFFSFIYFCIAKGEIPSNL